MSCCHCGSTKPTSGTKIESYVKVVAGGFTDELKEKLEGIEEGANRYVLPIADEDTLGGIKIGEGLVITEDGTLSLDMESVYDPQDTLIYDGGGAAGATDEDTESDDEFLDGGGSMGN